MLGWLLTKSSVLQSHGTAMIAPINSVSTFFFGMKAASYSEILCL